MPEEVVESEKIIQFKRHLDRYLRRHGIEESALMQANGISAKWSSLMWWADGLAFGLYGTLAHAVNL